MDLHAGQIQGFFKIPVDHMTALPIFAQYFKDLGLSGDNVVSVSPDAGRAKMARRFGEMLEGKVAYLNKTRPSHDSAAATEVIGDVVGKVAIMSDDMIVTGGTLLAGAKALKAAGAEASTRVRPMGCSLLQASRSSPTAISSASSSPTPFRSTCSSNRRSCRS